MLAEYYRKYFGKKDKVITNDNRVITGIFEAIDRPGDNGYEEWSISITINSNCGEELLESEIKSIESAE